MKFTLVSLCLTSLATLLQLLGVENCLGLILTLHVLEGWLDVFDECQFVEYEFGEPVSIWVSTLRIF